MRQRKTVALIALLFLSVINFALAAPLVVRGIREVSVDLVDVAEDAATASRKRSNPSDYSDKWWTDAGRATDKTNSPENISPRSSLGPRDSGTHPFPVGSPLPAHNNLPSPVHVDPNAFLESPQPSLGSRQSGNSHPLPLDVGLNPPPQPHQDPTDDHDSASSSAHSGSSHLTATGYEAGTESELSSDAESEGTMTTSPQAARPLWWEKSVFEFPKSSSPSPSHSSNPPSAHGDSDMDLNNPLPAPGPTDGQPPSDPRSSKRPYPLSDPGPMTRPRPLSYYTRPSMLDSEPSTPHPPSSPWPLQHGSEGVFGDLFKGRFRFRRRISGSRSANAVTVQKESGLQGNPWLWRVRSPLPLIFQLP